MSLVEKIFMAILGFVSGKDEKNVEEDKALLPEKKRRKRRRRRRVSQKKGTLQTEEIKEQVENIPLVSEEKSEK